MKKYDIYLVEFAYEGGSGSKWRPALILDGNIIRLSKITVTVIYQKNQISKY